jgi:hypothetical protein
MRSFAALLADVLMPIAGPSHFGSKQKGLFTGILGHPTAHTKLPHHSKAQHHSILLAPHLFVLGPMPLLIS